MESRVLNENKDDSSYLFLHNLMVLISQNIWKNKKLGYAFLIAINSLFFVSYLKDMNVLSILSFIIIIYILVSIIVAKKMNLKGKEYE
jgi:hypothetical protein